MKNLNAIAIITAENFRKKTISVPNGPIPESVLTDKEKHFVIVNFFHKYEPKPTLFLKILVPIEVPAIYTGTDLIKTIYLDNGTKMTVTAGKEYSMKWMKEDITAEELLDIHNLNVQKEDER